MVSLGKLSIHLIPKPLSKITQTQKPLRIAFIVQGEGRGHMVQAIEMKKIFESTGHQVVGVLIGRSKRRALPAFFEMAFENKLHHFESPNFITDNKDKAVRVMATILDGFLHTRTYWRSLQTIHDTLQELKPDLVFNFFDLMASFYAIRFRPEFPIIGIANQFLLLHPDFPKPKGMIKDWLGMHLLVWASSWRNHEKWCLSPIPMRDLPSKKVVVMPPILRADVQSLPKVPTENFILSYVINNGYAQELLEWHKRHPELTVHCFWDNPQVPPVFQPHPNFTFHQVDAHLFLEYLNRCRGLAGTAGFQTTCEAMYLKKPFVAMAVAGQYEQAMNASFLTRIGQGCYVHNLTLDWFVEGSDGNIAPKVDQSWLVNQSRFVTRLTDTVG